jgi:hypothetical protein
MYFLRPVGLSDLDQSAAISPVAGAMPGPFVICAPLLWQGQSSVDCWTAIYRLAYEQLLIAVRPSQFQRALEPSLN